MLEARLSRAGGGCSGRFFDTMACMQTDELSEHLDALQREECYRVDAVLKESAYEITQRVMFVGRNGAEQGPFIRKYIKRDAGLGSVYWRMHEAQRYGRRFRFLPRISDCYTLGEDDVVVMEYVWGETLQDAVYRCGPSAAFAADVFPRLCDAVLELHEGFDAPIIHRDLKPSNIMISRDSLTIIDLGIARFYKDDAADDTRHFGTRAYAPPEQFGYGQTTVRSDVYALGMLLYFCLVEKTPDARVREEGFFDERIPEPLRAVLMRATEFDPDRRYADVRELRAAFCAAARACGYGAIVSEAHAACGLARPAPPSGHASAPSGDVGPKEPCVLRAGCDAAPDGAHPASCGAFRPPSRSLSGRAQAGLDAREGGFAPPRRPRVSAASRAKAAFSEARRMLFEAKSRMPAALFVAWNTAVCTSAAVLLVGCVMAAFSPNEHDAAYPLWFRVLEYLVVGASSIVFLAYALADKRPLYERFAHFPRFSWWRQAAFFALYVLFAFALLGQIEPFVA